MSDLSESTNAVENSAPVARGFSGGDPASVQALEGLAKYRGTLGFAGKSAIMGAGMGAQAAQGAMNPLTAFLQGAAAGLQAPAQVFAQKQAQVKSTLDAMPFGARFPELAAKYPTLAGMPSALALDTLKTIAIDTQKVIEEHNARLGEISATGSQGRVTSESAQGYAALYQKATGKNIDPEILIGLNESEIKQFIDAGGVDMSKVFANEKSLRDEFSNQVKLENFSTIRDQYFNLSDAAKKGNAAGDMKMIFSYMKMLDPNSIVRESEYATAQNAAGIPSRIVVAYNKALEGESLSPRQRSEFHSEAQDIWKRKTNTFKSTVDTYRTLAKNSGFDPNRVVTNIGNVIAYTDPNDSNYIPLETPVISQEARKIGDVFSESANGYISTYKVVDVNGRMGRKRISVVEDTEE